MPLDRQPKVKRCYACGREGTRSFREIPPTTHEPSGQVFGPYMVCLHTLTCHRRQQRQHRAVRRRED